MHSLLYCHFSQTVVSDCGLVLIPTSGKASELRNGCIATRDGRWWVIVQGSWGRDVVDPEQVRIKMVSNCADCLTARARSRSGREMGEGKHSQAQQAVRSASFASISFSLTFRRSCTVGTYGTLYTFDSMIENAKQGGSSGVYGDYLPRLRAAKKIYDHKNIFRLNHNILPAQ